VSRLRRNGPAARSVHYATSPLLASPTPPWRSRFVVVLLALGSALLLGRAAYVQIVANDFFQKQGEKRYARTLPLPASRGRIVDRNGIVLATSVESPSVWAIPKEFQADAAQRRQLARALGLTNAELADKLDGDGQFAWLKRQVEESVWQQVKALGIPGIYQVGEFKRKYPEGEAAAHVVGFTNVEENGQEGIELAFQRTLQGKAGSRGVVRDNLKQIVEDRGERVDPVDGQDVQLSIDSKVQFFAWQRLRDAVLERGAASGSAVVLDARTGEVLALANYPSFDPAQRHPKGSPALRNRAATDVFEPGSTMKPLVVAWALESGRVRPESVLSTQPFQVTGITVKDDHPHAQLSVAEVVQKSSNVGAAKLALQMERRELWELFSQLGLGQKPQIEFPGAVTGRLRPYKTWRPIEHATHAYGYNLSTSLLQLARAYTVFGGDGEVMPLTIVKREGPPQGYRVLSAKTAKDMRRILQSVAAPGGTAPKAQAIGYSVGGKTGTARVQVGRDYATDKHRAFFVGLAPISDPRLVVAVLIDQPTRGGYYAGDVAAPVFSQIAQQALRTLSVPPDIEVQPQIVVKPGDAAPENL
jgi:cell division protein FtsI (penicillin-binding protein 3)